MSRSISRAYANEIFSVLMQNLIRKGKVSVNEVIDMVNQTFTDNTDTPGMLLMKAAVMTNDIYLIQRVAESLDNYPVYKPGKNGYVDANDSF